MSDKVKQLGVVNLLNFFQLIGLIIGAVWWAAGLDSRLAQVELKQDEKISKFEEVYTTVSDNHDTATGILDNMLKHKYTNTDHMVVVDPGNRTVKLALVPEK